MVYLFYTTYISVDVAHHEIFLGKGGIKGITNLNCCIRVSYTKQHVLVFVFLPRIYQQEIRERREGITLKFRKDDYSFLCRTHNLDQILCELWHSQEDYRICPFFSKYISSTSF